MTQPKARLRSGDYKIGDRILPGYSRVSRTKRSHALDWWLHGVVVAELARTVAEGDVTWAHAIVKGDVREFDTSSPATIKRRGELVDLEPHKAAAYVFKWAEDNAPREAADLGTAVHAAIEMVDAGMATVDDFEEEVRSYVESYLHAKAIYKWVVVEAEVTVASLVHGYAGTADLMVEVPGLGLVVADIKSGKDVWPDTAMQLAAYANADVIYDPERDEQRPLPGLLRPDVGVVIHVRPEGTRLVKLDLKGAWEAWRHLLAVAQWEDVGSKNAILGPLERPCDLGPRADDDAVAALKARHESLIPRERAWIGSLAAQAKEAGTPISVTLNPCVRNFEVARALIALAGAV